MRNLICAIMWIIWMIATIFLVLSIMGIIVLIDEDNGWFQTGQKLVDGITRD